MVYEHDFVTAIRTVQKMTRYLVHDSYVGYNMVVTNNCLTVHSQNQCVLSVLTNGSQIIFAVKSVFGTFPSNTFSCIFKGHKPFFPQNDINQSMLIVNESYGDFIRYL